MPPKLTTGTGKKRGGFTPKQVRMMRESLGPYCPNDEEAVKWLELLRKADELARAGDRGMQKLLALRDDNYREMIR